jgi:hypothetical protein
MHTDTIGQQCPPLPRGFNTGTYNHTSEKCHAGDEEE